MIILDTNVLSETMRPNPSEMVLHWLATQPAIQLFTTTITEAEILYGLALLDPGQRRTALEAAARAMFAEDFAGHVMPFDSAAALAFADIAASRRRLGRPISQADAQIAAIARTHGASIATRNVADFEGCRVALINPWAD
ncbi:MAG: type II toxin-antitoxin system VapC family toxin [Magnetospirillum sp.]|nr:type II toxin-antitoxin system VapC family toxin [Magnetospirillum sp.]